MRKSSFTRPADPPEGATSAVSSLKEIVTVIMALTMTNTLVLLLTKGKYSEVRSLGDLPPRETLFSALVILTIFRFYHGNIRHLDSLYGQPEGGGHTVKPTPRGGLGFDFFVILTQSILFAVMSFYSGRPEELLILFTILLASDVIWVLVVQQPSADDAGFSHQRNWILYNVLALIAILAIYVIAGGVSHDNFLIYGGAAVMLANAIIDFIINWSFYFPSDQQEETRPKNPKKVTVFLAAPLTQTLEKATGQVTEDYREWLEGLIAALEHAGHEVISAHAREHWGSRLDSPTTALKTDLEGLKKSHAVVAHVGNPPSPGVQFELGVATSLGIPVVLLLDRNEPRPYLNPALPAVTPADILELDGEHRSHRRILQALSDLLAERNGASKGTNGYRFPNA